MTMATTSFLMMPRRMVVERVYLQVFWYNYTIPENYISTTLGPAAIVLGRTYDYNHLCGEGTKFGEFVQTHEKTTNTMMSRTVSAICLRPSGNSQGSFFYYSLVTGRRLHRRKRTSLPMPKEMIDRVYHIAQRQKAVLGLVFTRIDGTPYGADDDGILEENDDDSEDNEPVDDEIAGVDDEEQPQDPDHDIEEFQDAVDEAVDEDN